MKQIMETPGDVAYGSRRTLMMKMLLTPIRTWSYPTDLGKATFFL